MNALAGEKRGRFLLEWARLWWHILIGHVNQVKESFQGAFDGRNLILWWLEFGGPPQEEEVDK